MSLEPMAKILLTAFCFICLLSRAAGGFLGIIAPGDTGYYEQINFYPVHFRVKFHNSSHFLYYLATSYEAALSCEQIVGVWGMMLRAHDGPQKPKT